MTILAKVSKFSQANQKSPSPPSPSPPSPPTLQSALEREAQAIRAQKGKHLPMAFYMEKLVQNLKMTTNMVQKENK